MNNGFLPVSRAEMEERGIKQFDFVYVLSLIHILKRMGRRTSNADLVRIITHLRERIPDITLRTTLICGFPGETKAVSYTHLSSKKM